MSEYGFGRIPSPPDERDWDSRRLAAMVEAGTAVPVSWDCPVTLNQGQTNHCVGFAGAAFLATSQYNAPGNPKITDADGHALYYAAQAAAGITPDDPAYEEGSYIRALFKALKARGDIDAYAFASTFADSQDWLQRYGSVVWGTLWYDGMLRPTDEGIIEPTGNAIAGHAWLQVADRQNPADNGLHNSWNLWGLAPKSVQAYISESGLYKLYDAQGEAGMAVRFVRPPFPWSDLEPLSVSADDRLSIQAAYAAGIFQGYSSDEFRPQEKVMRWHVHRVAGRLGLAAPDEWAASYKTVTRGQVHEQLPMLRFDEERWTELLTRYQMLLLVGRYLRGV